MAEPASKLTDRLLHAAGFCDEKVEFEQASGAVMVR